MLYLLPAYSVPRFRLETAAVTAVELEADAVSVTAAAAGAVVSALAVLTAASFISTATVSSAFVFTASVAQQQSIAVIVIFTAFTRTLSASFKIVAWYVYAFRIGSEQSLSCNLNFCDRFCNQTARYSQTASVCVIICADNRIQQICLC